MGAVEALAAAIIFCVALMALLARLINRSIGQVAGSARRLADGDFAVRLPESSSGRLGVLHHAFNGLADSLQRRDDERAALRRVAKLVERRAPLSEVCGAVTDELCEILDVDGARVFRYEPDGSVTVIATSPLPPAELGVGKRWGIDGLNIPAMVLQTGAPARINDFSTATGPIAEFMRRFGLYSAIGAPIIVDRAMWGVMIGYRTRTDPFTAESEQRLYEMTELVASVIANALARAELAASRARLVAAADHARQRIARDLHDGTQQQLVALVLDLRAAEEKASVLSPELGVQLATSIDELNTTLAELREFARGVHPGILAQQGLGTAVKTLAYRCPVPVELNVQVETRLPELIEVTTYYVVAEALTNIAKYSKATLAQITLELSDGWLHAAIRDDGVGGADPTKGTGITGLADRVETAGGVMTFTSPAGQGTSLAIDLPLSPPALVI